MELTFAPLPVPLYTDESGTVRVRGTRLIVDLLLRAYLRGQTAGAIAKAYPSVALADIHAIIAYYLQHRAVFDAYLEQRRAEADAIRAEIEAHQNQPTIRERLLTRRARLKAEQHAALDRWKFATSLAGDIS